MRETRHYPGPFKTVDEGMTALGGAVSDLGAIDRRSSPFAFFDACERAFAARGGVDLPIEPALLVRLRDTFHIDDDRALRVYRAVAAVPGVLGALRSATDREWDAAAGLGHPLLGALSAASVAMDNRRLEAYQYFEYRPTIDDIVALRALPLVHSTSVEGFCALVGEGRFISGAELDGRAAREQRLSSSKSVWPERETGVSDYNCFAFGRPSPFHAYGRVHVLVDSDLVFQPGAFATSRELSDVMMWSLSDPWTGLVSYLEQVRAGRHLFESVAADLICRLDPMDRQALDRGELPWTSVVERYQNGTLDSADNRGLVSSGVLEVKVPTVWFHPDVVGVVFERAADRDACMEMLPPGALAGIRIVCMEDEARGKRHASAVLSIPGAEQRLFEQVAGERARALQLIPPEERSTIWMVVPEEASTILGQRSGSGRDRWVEVHSSWSDAWNASGRFRFGSCRVAQIELATGDVEKIRACRKSNELGRVAADIPYRIVELVDPSEYI